VDNGRKDGPIFGYPKGVQEPFSWSELSENPLTLQTFEDLIELLEQLEVQNPSNVIIQAEGGIIKALKLCRVVNQHTQSPIHVVSHGVSEQQEMAARAIGVGSIHEVDSGYGELNRLIMNRAASQLGSGLSRHIVLGTLDMDLARRKVMVGTTPTTLTKTEFEILRVLCERPGEVSTRQELISHVWGDKWYGAANVLDTHLAHLRSKLADAGHKDALVTVRGIGFYFEPQLVREAPAGPRAISEAS
jgi:DNA-binding response OmpR family regulator